MILVYHDENYNMNFARPLTNECVKNISKKKILSLFKKWRAWPKKITGCSLKTLEENYISWK